MDSEPGFIWTLVQSFSLENTDIFRGKRFGINIPLNFDSRSSMSVELAARAVESIGRCIECRCTDYARAKLKNHDFFGHFRITASVFIMST